MSISSLQLTAQLCKGAGLADFWEQFSFHFSQKHCGLLIFHDNLIAV